MRLIIPTLSINVPVFFGKDGASRQEIIDKENSAVYFTWGPLTVIADHSSQANFHNLNKAKPGETIAYLCGDRVKKYICDRSEVGHIVSDGGNRLYDSRWMPVHENVKHGVCMYTCIERSAKNIMDVRLTHWIEYTGQVQHSSQQVQQDQQAQKEQQVQQAQQLVKKSGQATVKKVINKIRDLFKRTVVSA